MCSYFSILKHHHVHITLFLVDSNVWSILFQCMCRIMSMKNIFLENQKEHKDNIYFYLDRFMFYIIFVTFVAWKRTHAHTHTHKNKKRQIELGFGFSGYVISIPLLFFSIQQSNSREYNNVSLIRTHDSPFWSTDGIGIESENMWCSVKTHLKALYPVCKYFLAD